MAVSDKQKKIDIEEAQKYLRAVARHKGEIPEIIPDGIYGKETAEAVKKFQENQGLPATGQIDEETWNALYGAYKEAKEYFGGCTGIHPFVGIDVISAGFGGYPVYIIQAMINTMSQFYDNIGGVKINGIYDKQTSAQVKNLQEISGCDADGDINKHTWNCLARLYNFHAAMDESESLPVMQSGSEKAEEAAIMQTVKIEGNVG